MTDHDAESDRIVPDEVRRMRLEPGERLIVRHARLAPQQASEYQEYLQAWFPDNEVLVIVADEITVRSPLMTEADIDRFVEKVGRRLARAILPRAGTETSQRDEAAADAEYIQRAVSSPEEIRELRYPPVDCSPP